jgi:hypothetical protein
MIPLLFLPISSVFILVQFLSRVSLRIPPKPPDWVAIQSSSLKLPLCITTEGIATTQYLDIHSFPILLNVLQLFDEMPMSQVICNVITIRYAYRGLEVVEFELSKEWNSMNIVPPSYTLFILMYLCSLKFLNF